MKTVIGIDIGSSAIKASLFDLDGMNVLHSEHRALEARIVASPIGHFEENPNVIRTQVFDILRSIVQFATVETITIEAIALTGQMHGGLLVDSNLEPATDFITWQDKRGDKIEASGKSYVETLELSAPPDITSVGIRTGFLISTLYWLSLHHAIPPNSAYVLGVYDWLTSILVGKPVTDISSAAAWGMFDPITKTWHSELLGIANIPQSFLPEVAEPGSFIGTIRHSLADELGLLRNVHIHASIGDTQAAYLGSECALNEVLINFGTGSQSMWETSRLEATEGTDIRYLRNGRYLACAPTLAGGEAYLIAAHFFRDVVKEFSGNELSVKDALSVMDRLALESDSNGLTIDPIFRGSKFRPNTERGSITGVNSENFLPGCFVHALVEGMIEEIAVPYFTRTDNKMPAGIVGAGTALKRNAALRAAAEVRFGHTLRFGRFDEAASVGAAMLCSPLQS
jgi:xylulokinase